MTSPALLAPIAEPAARLRRIAACARDGRPIDPADAIPLQEAFDRHLIDGSSLDFLLGVTADGKGATPPWKALRIIDRDDAIRALASSLSEDVDGGNVLDAMLDELEQFANWRWPQLRLHQECPANPTSLEALMWQVLRLSGGRVLSRAYLAEILAG
ncbi:MULTISPECIES: hypothetical protein [unclassified Mesorhizobium]|uniref:hypothetical protein n=1 Tax=unclassified Mesorhizobium TaxID=325217 RepID=UPI001093BA86|nr:MULTISPECIES: hypothetical protein [unclassified Mesorhizobium]TGS46019.1 hypothetical protein EN825_10360 [Mesorhizobium sp. M8A.F.Ca.ET.182.01.1.1]TGS81474.1 hypothetical protein EN824_10575 [Mesorhizobium sp. M8A.F.Ca.ET.181.01.1.1]